MTVKELIAREEKPDEETIKQLEKKQEEDKFKKENKAAEEQIMFNIILYVII